MRVSVAPSSFRLCVHMSACPCVYACDRCVPMRVRAFLLSCRTKRSRGLEKQDATSFRPTRHRRGMSSSPGSIAHAPLAQDSLFLFLFLFPLSHSLPLSLSFFLTVSITHSLSLAHVQHAHAYPAMNDARYSMKPTARAMMLVCRVRLVFSLTRV